MTRPLVTVAVPSYNQGAYLEQALETLYNQDIPLEVFVMDAGSTDNSIEILRRWESKLAGLRIGPDAGQAAAINEGIAQGSAPFVCWLNSDDWLLPSALKNLLAVLQANPKLSAAYGKVWNIREQDAKCTPIWVEPFSERRLAWRCIISQPGTLIRRSAWECISGLDGSLHMAMDYDLWWRLYKNCGPLQMVDEYVAVNRDHIATKTNTKRRLHYREAMQTVAKYYGRIPIKWWLYQPYSVWFKTLKAKSLGRGFFEATQR